MFTLPGVRINARKSGWIALYLKLKRLFADVGEPGLFHSGSVSRRPMHADGRLLLYLRFR